MVELTAAELVLLEKDYPAFPPSHRSRKVARQSDHQTGNSQFDDGDINASDEQPAQELDRLPICCDKGCLATLTGREILERRLSIEKLKGREQDIVLLTHLVLGQHHDLMSHMRRKRSRLIYRFDRSREVCRTAFQYIYRVGDTRLKRLQKLASQGEFSPHLHGNTNHAPSNLLPQPDVDRLIKFVENVVEIHGLPMPGGMRAGHRETLLPSDFSYASVWDEYRASIGDLSAQHGQAYRVIGYDSFRSIWQQSFPWVKFQSNRSDLCDYCQETKDRLRYCESEEETQRLILRYQEHYQDVQTGRTIYHDEVNAAKQQWHALSKRKREAILSHLSKPDAYQDQQPCRLKIATHYSFDYAQQVHYPYSSQQKGTEYFITPRKCQVFGVCAEAISRQALFLTDESETKGKGSLAVISMLDAFFRLHGLGECAAHLHADNCVGQNKNNYVMWYLMWRVMNGLHEKITITFMPPGHTKFSPDSYFGLFKIKYRKSTIDSLGDLVACVSHASEKGALVPQPYGKHLGFRDPIYEYRNWCHYLERFFKPIDGITDYNYFAFDHERPGWVSLKTKTNDESEDVFLLKSRRFRFQHPVYYPPAVAPDGLSDERQQYLYKQVRPHVRNPHKRDLTCPPPPS
jgi:hypothetical protein